MPASSASEVAHSAPIGQDDLPAIIVDGVSKHFSLPADRVQTLKERALHPIRSRQRNEFTALDDVSFHIEKGEFFGLVGKNGSGKSTLLKCIAGIYSADGGEIYHDGTLSSFIELGVGFNPELPAYDNVLLNATLLGLDTEAAKASFKEVMDFSGLWEFENLKLKNYSSGMYVRLAFSVMLQIDADILLIDEVLAVGDAAFQQKCFDQFERMREEGKTIVFVSHGMDAVRRFCDRAMLLDHGNVVAIGSSEDIAERYLELNYAANGDTAEEFESAVGKAKLTDCWVECEGERTKQVKQEEIVRLHAEVEFDEAAQNPWIEFQIRDDQERLIAFVTSQPGPSGDGPAPSGSYAPGESAHYRMGFNCVLSAGRYAVTISSGPDRSYSRYFRRDAAMWFNVEGSSAGDAVLSMPIGWEVQKSSEVTQ